MTHALLGAGGWFAGADSPGITDDRHPGR